MSKLRRRHLPPAQAARLEVLTRVSDHAQEGIVGVGDRAVDVRDDHALQVRFHEAAEAGFARPQRRLGPALLRHVLGRAGRAAHDAVLIVLHDGIDAQVHRRTVPPAMHGLVVEMGHAILHAREHRQVFFHMLGRRKIRERSAEHFGGFVAVNFPHRRAEKRPAPAGIHGPDQVVRRFHQRAVGPFAFLQGELGTLAIGDVDVAAEHPGQPPRGIGLERRLSEHPAVGAVAVAQAELDFDGRPLAPLRDQGLNPGEHRAGILGMQARGPLRELVGHLVFRVAELPLPFRRKVYPVGRDVPFPQADVRGAQPLLQAHEHFPGFRLGWLRLRRGVWHHAG